MVAFDIGAHAEYRSPRYLKPSGSGNIVTIGADASSPRIPTIRAIVVWAPQCL